MGSACLAPELPAAFSPNWRFVSLSLRRRIIIRLRDSLSLPHYLGIWAAAPFLQAYPLLLSRVASRGLSKHLVLVVHVEMRSFVAQHDRIKDAARRLWVLI